MDTPTPPLTAAPWAGASAATDAERVAWLEAQLRDSQKLATLGTLSAGVAHEVKTPLQFVSDTLTFAQESAAALSVLVSSLRAAALLDPADRAAAFEAVVLRAQEPRTTYFLEQLPEALDQAVDGLAQVTRLVAAIKEFSHPGLGGKDMTDLNRVVEAAVLLTRGEWKGVATVATDLDPALPRAETCADEIRQVVINLVVNAAQAIEDARAVTGSSSKGTIRVSTRASGDAITLCVEDSGCGIDPVVGERIFEPFFTTKEAGRGSGQGLALAHAVVVDGHGGHIDVRSAVGKGTTFTVTLPLRGATPASRAA